jgi:hypothetical protein
MKPIEQLWRHAVCMVLRPRSWRWHYAGIVRALA